MIKFKYRQLLNWLPWGSLGLSLGIAIMLFGPVPHAQAAPCTPPGTDYGTVTQTVSIPSSGTYRIWSRLKADAAAAANDTYLLEIDGTTCFVVGGSGISTSTWTWVDYQNGTTSSKINAALTSGNHTIKMIGNEANVQLDRVIFTADLTCVPTGTGENCANPPDTTPPTVNITQPANGATVTPSTTVNVTATDDVAIGKVELRVDGSLVATDTSSPYSFNITLSAGSHSLVATAFDSSNNNTASSTVNVTVPDTTAPTIATIASSSISQTSATITWTTNEAADSQVEYGPTTSYGTNTPLNASRVTNHSVGLSGLSPGTLYHYRVKSRDAAGNLATSPDRTFTTSAPAGDTTQPTVSLTAPAANATVSGNVTVSASASDNVAVAGVQFLLDGNNLGTEDTTAPYSLTWNTTGVSNGSHTLSARARDAAGNARTATNITVTINNPTTINEDINQDGRVNLLDLSIFASRYGQSGASLGRSDINGDGVVNLLDLSRLASKYGT